MMPPSPEFDTQLEGNMEINLGIKKEDREQIAAGLSKLLADSYTLYLKTHNYHWNVTGPHFGELHAMFEAQYLDLADAVDEIAERIRALGHQAPGSYSQFSARTAVPEASGGKTSAMDMVAALAHDHETVANDRQQIHEKTAWMLRSYLE
jgi:starvation-inducible DNA-binding protein